VVKLPDPPEREELRTFLPKRIRRRSRIPAGCNDQGGFHYEHCASEDIEYALRPLRLGHGSSTPIVGHVTLEGVHSQVIKSTSTFTPALLESHLAQAYVSY
jgi:hypothetical protein